MDATRNSDAGQTDHSSQLDAIMASHALPDGARRDDRQGVWDRLVDSILELDLDLDSVQGHEKGVEK